MKREILSHCDKNSAHNVGGKYRWILGAPILNVLNSNLWVTGKDTHICLMYPHSSIFCNFFTYIFRTGVKQSLWKFIEWRNYKISFCFCETTKVRVLKSFMPFMWLSWTHTHRKFLLRFKRFVFTILWPNRFKFSHILKQKTFCLQKLINPIF